MEQNKSGKYLKYAIGEIVLVVIGILIALSINNWNESRKDGKIETKALMALQLEFTESLNKINQLINRKIKQENKGREYAKILASDTLTIKEKVAADAPGTHRGILGAQNPVLKSLMNTGDFSKIKNDSLKTILNNWMNSVETYLVNEIQYENAVIKSLDFIEDKYYRSVVNPGNYNESWPGSFRPKTLEAKNVDLEAKFVTSIKYYNINADIVLRLYIQLISLNILKEENIEILKLINHELSI